MIFFFFFFETEKTFYRFRIKRPRSKSNDSTFENSANFVNFNFAIRERTRIFVRLRKSASEEYFPLLASNKTKKTASPHSTRGKCRRVLLFNRTLQYNYYSFKPAPFPSCVYPRKNKLVDVYTLIYTTYISPRPVKLTVRRTNIIPEP